MAPRNSGPSIVPVHINCVNPFTTAVPFWGQTAQILSSVSPKRDCGPKRVNMCQWVKPAINTDETDTTPDRGIYGFQCGSQNNYLPHIFLVFLSLRLCQFRFQGRSLRRGDRSDRLHKTWCKKYIKTYVRVGVSTRRNSCTYYTTCTGCSSTSLREDRCGSNGVSHFSCIRYSFLWSVTTEISIYL